MYDYIRVADDKKIKAIYTMLEDQIIPAADWFEDEEFVAELDQRMKSYEDGLERGNSWEELESSIAALKKKRAAK